jgi:hypothetical protein
MPSLERDKLTITRDQFLQASAKSGVADEQAASMWTELNALTTGGISAGFYLGGVLMLMAGVGAGYWFSDKITFKAAAEFSFILMCAFGFAANWVGKKPDTRVSSGVLYILSDCMMPVVVACAAAATFNRPDNPDGLFLAMSFCTMFFGLMLTSHSRISFVLLPALVAGAMATSTLTHIVFNYDWNSSTQNMALVLYGVGNIGLALIVEGESKNSKEDFAFWLYLVGASSLWLGLSLMVAGAEMLGYSFFALGGVFSMMVARLFQRSVFALLGGAAVLWTWGYFGWNVFNWSLPFIGMMGFAGLVAWLFTAWYKRNAASIDAVLLSLTPPSIRRFLPLK